MRRGTFRYASCGSRSREEEGPSLEAPRPAQFSAVVQQLSPQTRVGSGRRPQAMSRLGDSFRSRISRRSCSVVGAVIGRAVAARGSRKLLREGKAVVGKTTTEARAGPGDLPRCRPLGDSRESVARGRAHASEEILQLQKSMGGSLIHRSACRRCA